MLLNNIICGDFSHTGRGEEYVNWTCAAGAWELSDPNVVTFTSGRALDRFLLLPGDCISGALLPGNAGTENDSAEHPEEEEGGFYPAVTHTKIPGYAHQPVSLTLPFVREEKQPRIRTL